MVNFIEPKIKVVFRDYIGEHTNNPVNISLCTELISYDKPNGYGLKHPVIKFKGCGVTWYFGLNGHKKRDEQYAELIANCK